MSYAYPFTQLPPLTSGPAGGKGCVCDAEQEVGNVLHVVQTFHQLRPVPPLECGVQVVEVYPARRNEHGRLSFDGTEFAHDATEQLPAPEPVQQDHGAPFAVQ